MVTFLCVIAGFVMIVSIITSATCIYLYKCLLDNQQKFNKSVFNFEQLQTKINNDVYFSLWAANDAVLKLDKKLKKVGKQNVKK